MTPKAARTIKLKNAIADAVSQALADTAIVGLEGQISAYRAGDMTATEFLEYLDSISIKRKEIM